MTRETLVNVFWEGDVDSTDLIVNLKNRCMGEIDVERSFERGDHQPASNLSTLQFDVYLNKVWFFLTLVTYHDVSSKKGFPKLWWEGSKETRRDRDCKPGQTDSQEENYFYI